MSLIGVYNQYKSHGIMPFSGSPMEQPSKIIEIFSIIESICQEKADNEKKPQLPDRVQKKLDAKRNSQA